MTSATHSPHYLVRKQENLGSGQQIQGQNTLNTHHINNCIVYFYLQNQRGLARKTV